MAVDYSNWGIPFEGGGQAPGGITPIPLGSPDSGAILPSLPQIPNFDTGFFDQFQPGQGGFIPEGGFQAPQFGPLQVPGVQAPSLPSLADILGQATGAAQQLPQIADLTGQIEQLGSQRQQAFLQGLQPTFGQQREQLGERVAQKGLIGAGAEEELQRRLSGAQTQQASQGLAEIQSQTLSQLVQEQQQRREIETTRLNTLTSLATELGTTQADIQSRFGLQAQQIASSLSIADRDFQQSAFFEAQANNLKAQGLELQADQLSLDAENSRQSALLNKFNAEISKAEVILSEQELITDQEKLELDEDRATLDSLIKLAATPKISKENRRAIINNALEFLNSLDLPEAVKEQIASSFL
jgi:hypothetical protein